MESKAETALWWIEKLKLQGHPEGGWYREVYKSGESIPQGILGLRFAGDRPVATSIYFLLEFPAVSALHRIPSDEIWCLHAASPETSLHVHMIRPNGVFESISLGYDLAAGQNPQGVVQAGCWFGAEVCSAKTHGNQWVLVGCVVAPGFDFADFELGTRAELLVQYSGHDEIIRRLTPNS